MLKPRIRRAEAKDFDALCDIHNHTPEIFRDYGLEFVPDNFPRTEEFYKSFFDGCDILIAFNDTSQPAGFVLIEEVDGQAHIKQLSVHENHRRKGFGTALMKAALTEIRNQGYNLVTLTTWRDIPFNAPFYRKLGFEEFRPDQSVFPVLLDIVRTEAERGYAVQPRICMKMAVGV